MSRNAHRYRQRWWVDGLYEDENGDTDSTLSMRRHSQAAGVSVGRNNALALLFDLYYGKSLILAAHLALSPTPGRHPSTPRSVEPDVWVKFFRTCGIHP